MSLYLAGTGIVSVAGALYLQYRYYREDNLKTDFLSITDREDFFRQIHEKTAESYEYHMKDYEWAKRIDKYRKVLCSYAEGKVLEIGIGIGMNFGLYSNSISLTGIDWSARMLKKCNENIQGRTQLLVMNAKNLQFPDESFDTVVSTFVLSSSDDPDKIMEEAKRVCKKGGRVLVLDRGRGDDWLTQMLLWLYRYEYLFKLGYDQFSNIEKIIERSGLKVEVVERRQGNSIYFYILRKV